MCIYFLQQRKPAILPCLQVSTLMNVLVTLMEVHVFGLQIFDIVYLFLDSISEISSVLFYMFGYIACSVLPFVAVIISLHCMRYFREFSFLLSTCGLSPIQLHWCTNELLIF